MRPLLRLHRSLSTVANAAIPKKRVTPLSIVPRTQLALRAGDKRKAFKLSNLEIDGRLASFDNLFLRDACRCAYCLDPSTQQKLIRTVDIPTDIFPRLAQASDDGTLRIDGWENDLYIPDGPDPHVSVYDIGFLRKYAELRWRLRHNYNDRRQVLWDARLIKQDMMWVDYREYMEDDLKLFEAVRQLSLYGLVFIRGVPETPEQNAVEGIAGRIGNLKNTFYGKTWDVKSTPNAQNIAYTSRPLDLHMDLLYFESPPGLQFLHCLRPSLTGGASLFADSFRAAASVRIASDMLFRSLLTFPVTYHYRNGGHHYHFTRPTVTLENPTYLQMPRIAAVSWAPMFQAPFETGIHVTENAAFRQYLHAVQGMAASLDAEASVLEVEMKEGECVVFANRRVVHGRRAFGDGGDGRGRWLRGAYVDGDAFLSRFRMLSERFSKSEASKVVEYGGLPLEPME